MNFKKTRLQLAAKKALNSDNLLAGNISLADPIEKHAAWAYENIYAHPYINKAARSIHGIPHVANAAIFITVFANLYRKYGDADALNLSHEDLKLLQIAALFHDAARENEGADLWDHESGLFLYFYLTKILKVEHTKATLMAEAIANKETDANKNYLELVVENDELVWKASNRRKKNIYQTLIHDADCLEIIRARDHFDATYLYFYQQLVCGSTPGQTTKNQSAFDDMAKLITEARSLIEMRGDSRVRLKKDIKQRYENKDAYSLLVNLIKSERHPLIKHLYADESLLSATQLSAPAFETKAYDPTLGVTAENLHALLTSEQVFILARGIASPAAHSLTKNGTLAQIEIRKTYRLPDGVPIESYTLYRLPSLDKLQVENITDQAIILVPADGFYKGYIYKNKQLVKTKHSKPIAIDYKASQLLDGCQGMIDRTTMNASLHDQIAAAALKPIMKNGNPHRSTSLLGWGATLYAPVGFLIINPNPNDMNVISSLDRDTNRGKKHALLSTLTANEKLIELKKVRDKQKMGGESRTLYDYADTHTEITYRISKYDAIYFTNDPTVYNKIEHGHYDAYHPYSTVLQAIHLQIQHFKATGIKLPIVEYSSYHNYFKAVPDYSPETIKAMYVAMCAEYVQRELDSGRSSTDLLNESMDDIKAKAMHKNLSNHAIGHTNAPADANLDAKLINEINSALSISRANIITEFSKKLFARMTSQPFNAFDDEFFYHFISDPSICSVMKDSLQKQLAAKLQTTNLVTEFAGFVNYYEISFPKNIKNNKASLYSAFFDYIDKRNLLRLYALAVRINHQQTIMAIRNEAINKFNELLVEFKKEIAKHQSLNSTLGKLVTIAMYFDFFEANAKQIMELIDRSLEIYRQPNAKSRDIFDFQLLIGKIADLGLLDYRLIVKAELILSQFSEEFPANNYSAQSSRDRIGYTQKSIDKNGKKLNLRQGINLLKLELLDTGIFFTTFLHGNITPDAVLPVIAAQNSRLDLLDGLQQASADLNQANLLGQTAAHIAAENNDVKVIQKLAALNANVELLDNSGYTPLMIAVHLGHMEAMLAILSTQAHSKISPAMALTLLEIATQRGHALIVKALLSSAIQLTDLGKHAFPLAMLAATKGSVDILKEFSAAGMDLKQLSDNKTSLLHIATQESHVGMIEYLTNIGLDVNQPNGDGLTPATIAVMKDNSGVLEVLIAVKANINCVNNAGESLLHLAARTKRWSNVINLLIKAKINLNLQNKDGLTAIMVLVQQHEHDRVVKIANHGADLNIADKDGNTAIHIALKLDCDKHGFEMKQILIDLLKFKPSLTLLNAQGESPLYLALQIKDDYYGSAIRQLLIENGANINEEYKNGDTPLHLCIRNNQSSALNSLLLSKADVNKANHDGDTALHLLIKHPNFYALLHLLRCFKPEINKPNAAGYTPAMLAYAKGDHDALNELLCAGALLSENDKKVVEAARLPGESLSVSTFSLFGNAIYPTATAAMPSRSPD